jgi:SAM-dependent methyltransferase
MPTSPKPVHQLSPQFEPMLAHVRTEISPNDTMFEGNHEHYFAVGRSALHCIRLGMLAAGRADFSSILDFACGFGRVSRVLRAAFPRAELAVCDISREAVDYCAGRFDAKPVYSNESPSGITISRTFDLIWCGSLLTHLESPQFIGFLDLFRSLLSPGGLLVFTTHGPFVAKRIRTGEYTYGIDEARISPLIQDYEATGFGYADYPGSTSEALGLSKYGIVIAKPWWICRCIEQLPDVRLLTYTEKIWDNHQDSIALIRE